MSKSTKDLLIGLMILAIPMVWGLTEANNYLVRTSRHYADALALHAPEKNAAEEIELIPLERLRTVVVTPRRTLVLGSSKEEKPAARAGTLPCAEILREPTPTENKAVRRMVLRCFGDEPALLRKMIAIAICESRFSHFDWNDPTKVLKGRLSQSDMGVFQINGIHDGVLAQLGLNKRDARHNIIFARYLANQQGTRPWYMSAKCQERTDTQTAVLKYIPTVVALN